MAIEEKRNYTKITLRVFNAVKTLLAGGATNTECADYMGIAQNTVSRIKHAETYEDYKQATRVAGWMTYGKNQKKPEETNENQPEATETVLKQPGGQLSAAYQINRIVELLKTQNEILTLLSNKVAFIVDELTK